MTTIPETFPEAFVIFGDPPPCDGGRPIPEFDRNQKRSPKTPWKQRRNVLPFDPLAPTQSLNALKGCQTMT